MTRHYKDSPLSEICCGRQANVITAGGLAHTMGFNCVAAEQLLKWSWVSVFLLFGHYTASGWSGTSRQPLVPWKDTVFCASGSPWTFPVNLLLKGDDFWTSNQGCTTDLIKRKIHLYPRDTTRVKGAKRRVFHTPQISYAWFFFTVKIGNWLWGGVGVSSVLKIYPLIPGTYSILKLLLSLWIDNMSVFIMTGKPISLPLGLTRPPLTALISYVDWDSKILSPANTQLDSLGNTVISINLL